MLIARIYEISPLVCPRCGIEMRIIAFVTDAQPVERILAHLGEPATPPPISQARAPPGWAGAEADQTPAYDPELGERPPEFDFDQTVTG